jgi:drug/metabolite transporter (DMT)-like permease
MRAGILMLFEPVVAVTLAAILLQEAIRPIQVVGALGVLGAALLLRRSAEEAPEPRATEDDEVFRVGVPGAP